MSDLYIQAIETRDLYRLGKITREEAKERIKPYADFYNAKGREIAAKYNRKHKPFSFAAFMR